MNNKIACISLFLAISTSIAAQAECPKWERLSQTGQKAIEAGDYKRAESTWLKAVAEAENCGEHDPSVPLSLKRLGECYQKNSKYVEAADSFKKASEQYKIIGSEDPEMLADLAALAKMYRTIELSEINKPVADAFKQSGVNLIAICKLDQGNRIQMNLDDKFVKQIDNPDVDQVSLEKLVTFDVLEEADGSLTISNIKGLRVHAKMWVTIVQSHIQPKNPDGASAEVTASKMGITKTVSCKLPSDSIEPMNTLIAKLKDFSNGVTATETASSTTSQSETKSAGTTDNTASVTQTKSDGTSTTNTLTEQSPEIKNTPQVHTDETPSTSATADKSSAVKESPIAAPATQN